MTKLLFPGILLLRLSTVDWVLRSSHTIDQNTTINMKNLIKKKSNLNEITVKDRRLISFYKQLKCCSFPTTEIRKLEVNGHIVRREDIFMRKNLKLLCKIIDQVKRTIHTLGC